MLTAIEYHSLLKGRKTIKALYLFTEEDENSCRKRLEEMLKKRAPYLNIDDMQIHPFAFESLNSITSPDYGNESRVSKHYFPVDCAKMVQV